MTTKIFKLPFNKPRVVGGSPEKEESKPVFADHGHYDIAFIYESYPNYSGGRYYDFTNISALIELGYKVVIYTNLKPDNYINDFLQNLEKKPPIYVVDFNQLNLWNVSCVMGSQTASIYALYHGARYRIPTYLFLYDNPEWVLEEPEMYKRKFGFGEAEKVLAIGGNIQLYKDRLKELLRVVVLTENSRQDFADWLGLPVEQIFTLEPFINIKCAENITYKPYHLRDNNLISISRNDTRKNWENTIEIFSHFQDKYTLNIVTDSINGFEKYFDRYNININKVKFYHNIPDVKKFELINNSKALINTSFFEGYGIWIKEAEYFGTPVVMYDLKCTENIKSSVLNKITRFNSKEYVDKLRSILDKNDYIANGSMEYKNRLIEVYTLFNNINKSDYITLSEETNYTGFKVRHYNTRPVVMHFNSIYGHVYPTFNLNHLAWKYLLNLIYKNRFDCKHDPNLIDIFSVNNSGETSVLEAYGKLVGANVNIIGKDISREEWSWIKRMEVTLDYIKQTKCPYFLHVDSTDAVISGDLTSLLDIKDHILFGAEEACFPYSDEMYLRQKRKNQSGTHFHCLNAGVFFGSKELLIEMIEQAIPLETYPATSNEVTDQGKYNQLYVNETLPIKIDNKCEYFYCNDRATNAFTSIKFI